MTDKRVFRIDHILDEHRHIKVLVGHADGFAAPVSALVPFGRPDLFNARPGLLPILRPGQPGLFHDLAQAADQFDGRGKFQNGLAQFRERRGRIDCRCRGASLRVGGGLRLRALWILLWSAATRKGAGITSTAPRLARRFWTEPGS